MAGTTDVKTLLLEVDASVELLRRNLTRGDQAVGQFETETRQRLERMDRRFEQLGGGLRQLPGTIGRARAQIATIGTTVERVEGQVRASSGAMRNALLSSTAAIGAALSVNKIKDYADGYTRFTNQLKIAGLEGGALAKTQNDLYGIAQRYGVQLEALGSLYGRTSQAGRALGASQGDLLKLTSAVGAAQKVQGGTAEQSAGAILQLSQALGTGTVRAEEFNSVNEGLRPILQAAADASDKYKGSVAALRQGVLAGKVTSKEFFDLILAGLPALEKTAARANLTIGASFTTLNNALGKYIGETDASLSATQRISGGITALANNLDTIIPALTTIGIAYGTTKAAGLAFGGVTSVIATVAEADRALAQQVLLGNASFVSRSQLAARSAELAAAGAATEVAGIENTIAARRSEQVVLAEQIAAERTLIIERRAAAQAAAVSLTQGGLDGRTTALAAQRKAENDAAFATARLTAARERLAIVDGELSVAEGTLAGAHARSAVAAEAAAVATTQATLAARAGAAASRLFAGALTLIGGSVAGGAAILAIGALVAAVIAYRNQAAEVQADNKATADTFAGLSASSRALNARLGELTTGSALAASGVAQVGSTASISTGKVLAFAGAVGEAASKLYDLAKARQHEQILGFANESATAEHEANLAQGRIDRRNKRVIHDPTGKTGGVPLSDGDPRREPQRRDHRRAKAHRTGRSLSRRPGREKNSLGVTRPRE